MTINKVHQCKDNSELKEMKQKDEILSFFLSKFQLTNGNCLILVLSVFASSEKTEVFVYMDTHTEEKK